LPTVVFFEFFGEDILELVEGELLDALVAVAAILGGDVDVASTESLKGRSLRAVRFPPAHNSLPLPFVLELVAPTLEFRNFSYFYRTQARQRHGN
jgi:hypothetical protein